MPIRCSRGVHLLVTPKWRHQMRISYGVAPHNGHFREWGCVTYVHEDDPKGFNVKAKKGYLLNCSRYHADGCFDIYMCDTKRVKQTMNCIFMEDGNISPANMPDDVLFELHDAAPVATDPNLHAVPFVYNQPTGPFVPSKAVEKFPMPKTFVGGASKSYRKCRYSLDDTIQMGDMSRVKGTHIHARCAALDGKTVRDAFRMSYYHGGQYKRYSNIDLNYDCSSKSLIITSPVAVHNAILPSIHYTSGGTPFFDTTPLQPVESHVNGYMS